MLFVQRGREICYNFFMWSHTEKKCDKKKTIVVGLYRIFGYQLEEYVLYVSDSFAVEYVQIITSHYSGVSLTGQILSGIQGVSLSGNLRSVR